MNTPAREELPQVPLASPQKTAELETRPIANANYGNRASRESGSVRMSPTEVFAIQRSAGNRAVTAVLGSRILKGLCN